MRRSDWEDACRCARRCRRDHRGRPQRDRQPISTATRRPRWRRCREALCRTAANASSIAWATSAGAMARAGCGSAGASRSAWSSMRARPCAPNRWNRCSTPIPRSRAPRWSIRVGPRGAGAGAVRRAGGGRDARAWPRIVGELRHLADGLVHTAKVQAFLRHPEAVPGRHPPQRQDRPRAAGGVGGRNRWRPTHEDPRHRGGGFLGQALCRGPGRTRHAVTSSTAAITRRSTPSACARWRATWLIAMR